MVLFEGEKDKSVKSIIKQYVSVEEYKNIELLLEPPNEKWWEEIVVLVAYSLPRISTRLERLMGTNVIRLTDRKYMTELRLRIAQDYQVQLAKRIDSRECKEIERERNLILEGKTNVVPDDLAAHPIFIVNKEVNEIIIQRRAMLKTNREQNSERLQRQGVKWERERIFFGEAEKAKEIKFKKRQEELAALEKRYCEEDATNKLNLLRIKNDEWQASEEKLKYFLEQQRNKMKSRSWKVPTPFIRDPLDIVYKLREKKRLEDKRLHDLKNKENRMKVLELEKLLRPAKRMLDVNVQKPNEKAEPQKPETKRQERKQEKPEIDALNSVVFFEEINSQLEEDVMKGLLMSKEQYASMYYTDPKVARLKMTNTIKELYILAEDIIVGGLEELAEEEFGFEELGEEEEEEEEAEAEEEEEEK